MEKQKNKKEQNKRLPRVPRQGHSGKGFLIIKGNNLPRVLEKGHSGKSFFKKINFFPECCTRGRGNFFKKTNFFPECCTNGRVFF
jgi:hypothetical protein